MAAGEYVLTCRLHPLDIYGLDKLTFLIHSTESQTVSPHQDGDITFVKDLRKQLSQGEKWMDLEDWTYIHTMLEQRRGEYGQQGVHLEGWCRLGIF